MEISVLFFWNSLVVVMIYIVIYNNCPSARQPMRTCCFPLLCIQIVQAAGKTEKAVMPDYPDDRIQYIFEDSGAPFIITTKEITEERKDNSSGANFCTNCRIIESMRRT